MSENNVPAKNMDVVVVIDTDKLPEDVREVLRQLSEGKLPEGGPDKIKEMLKSTGPPKTTDNKQDNTAKGVIRQTNDKPSADINKLFAVQTGTVVGNIYDKNFKLEDIINKDKSQVNEGGT